MIGTKVKFADYDSEPRMQIRIGSIIDKFKDVCKINQEMPSGKGGTIMCTQSIALDYYLILTDNNKIIKTKPYHIIEIIYE